MKRFYEPPNGFTLIEMMVTIAIAAILLAIGIPSFKEFQRSSELSSSANLFLNGMTAARSEAMKRNTYSMLTPPEGSSKWSDGWRIFVDSNMNSQFDGTDTVVLNQGALTSNLTVTATGTANDSSPYVLFNGSGYPITSMGAMSEVTLSLKRADSTDFKQIRRIMVAKTGRVRVCKPTATTDTNCLEGAVTDSTQ